MTTSIAKGIAIFIAMCVILTVNGDDGVVARMGFQLNVGLVVLVSLCMALLLVEQKAMITGAVLLLCLVANMPPEFVLNFGLDRDLYTGIATAVMLAPVADRVFD